MGNQPALLHSLRPSVLPLPMRGVATLVMVINILLFAIRFSSRTPIPRNICFTFEEILRNKIIV
jgi:hypothetical protein